MSTGDIIQTTRAKLWSENKTNFPNIITCPSELVALSAALGYAQATGVPVGDCVHHINRCSLTSRKQCVIVHVDCGTLAMGQSIHNASVSRVPVLCFAGLSPFTQNGEMLGSRTELASPRRIFTLRLLTLLQVHPLAARCTRSSSDCPTILQIHR